MRAIIFNSPVTERETAELVCDETDLLSMCPLHVY